MCGLFGTHKNHKITTNIELKVLNSQIIKVHRTLLNGLADISEVKNSEDLKEYMQTKVSVQRKIYRDKIIQAYEVNL